MAMEQDLKKYWQSGACELFRLNRQPPAFSAECIENHE